jgi:hypothetical protein
MNKITEYKLNEIVRICDQAIYESEMAIGDNEKGYPYASGYARSALQLILDEIKLLKTHLQSEDN